MPNIYGQNYTPEVIYWMQPQGGEISTRQDGICFGILRKDLTAQNKYDEWRYQCPIDKGLSREKVEKYLGFVQNILDVSSFTFEFLNETDAKGQSYSSYVMFTIDCKKVNINVKLLMYLSFFRYINEFPEIVDKLVSGLGENLNKNFELFCEVHANTNCGKYNNLFGHGCLHGAAYKTVDLDTFRKNVESKSKSSVQSHFYSTAS